MASFPKVRRFERISSAPAEGSRTFRHRLVIAAFLFAAAAGTAFALSELATPQGDRPVHATPEFLTRELGAPQPTASLVRTPASGLRVSIRNHGFTYAAAWSGALSISATGMRSEERRVGKECR